MLFHGVYVGLDHTMAGIGRPIPWLWKLWSQRNRHEGAGGVRAAMRGYGGFVQLGSQACHGDLLSW